MNIMEIYKWALKEGEWHDSEMKRYLLNARSTALNVGERENYLQEAERHTALRMAFYQVAGKLEETEEVNPTKIEIDFYSKRDLPAIGEIIERDGFKWKAIDNNVRNVATFEKVK